mmetsp:Transcript_11094/g.28040  ORF Transcript_11094/g.28040 Transcript_11094/m.28040 type:complete len:94 (-) Transcript_11094:892-1173(-)
MRLLTRHLRWKGPSSSSPGRLRRRTLRMYTCPARPPTRTEQKSTVNIKDSEDSDDSDDCKDTEDVEDSKDSKDIEVIEGSEDIEDGMGWDGIT